jgi:hypothetical protein
MHVLIGIAFRTKPINKEITLNILARRPIIDSITVGGVDITPGEDLHIQWFADRGFLPIDPHRLYEEPLFGEFLSRAVIPSVNYAKWAAAVAQASWFDLPALDPSRVFIRPRRIADTVLLFPDDTSPAKQYQFVVDSDWRSDTIAFSVRRDVAQFLLRRSKDCIAAGKDCLQGDADCTCGWQGGVDDAGDGDICECPLEP